MMNLDLLNLFCKDKIIIGLEACCLIVDQLLGLCNCTYMVLKMKYQTDFLTLSMSYIHNYLNLTKLSYEIILNYIFYYYFYIGPNSKSPSLIDH